MCIRDRDKIPEIVKDVWEKLENFLIYVKMFNQVTNLQVNEKVEVPAFPDDDDRQRSFNEVNDRKAEASQSSNSCLLYTSVTYSS